jgi:hypothetical protein
MLLAGLDSGPKVVEGDAFLERGSVDGLAFVHPHDPGVAVLVGLRVVGDSAAVPGDDHGVTVGVYRSDGDGVRRGARIGARAPVGRSPTSAAQAHDSDRTWAVGS